MPEQWAGTHAAGGWILLVLMIVTMTGPQLQLLQHPSRTRALFLTSSTFIVQHATRTTARQLYQQV
jgi:hypothetical protein